MLHLILIGCALQLVAAQENLDKAADELKILNKESNLDLSKAFRCGMFFPDPKDANALPISPLLIFNATWPAEECPNPDTERHNSFCDEIVRETTDDV